MLRETADHNHSSNLELVIIALIGVELALGAAELVGLYGLSGGAP